MVELPPPLARTLVPRVIAGRLLPTVVEAAMPSVLGVASARVRLPDGGMA